MEPLKKAARRYRSAEKAVEVRRLELHRVIQNEHLGGKSLRAIAEETGFSWGRIGQIVRGEG